MEIEPLSEMEPDEAPDSERREKKDYGKTLAALAGVAPEKQDAFLSALAEFVYHCTED